MKRLIAASLLSVSALMAGAHNAGSNCSDQAHSGMFADISAGAETGDFGDDFALALKVGYRLNLYEGLSWNIASMGAGMGVSYPDDINMRFMSGFRYNLPFCFNNRSVYVNADFGYCFSTSDTAFGGFAYEVGAGVNFSRLISLGIVWEGSVWNYHEETYLYELSAKCKFGTIGLKLGFNF